MLVIRSVFLEPTGFYRPGALCAIFLLAIAGPVLAMSGHPDELDCGEPLEVGNAWQRTPCTFSGEPYVPPGVDWDYPVTWIYPNPLPAERSLRLKVKLHGFQGAPDVCLNDDGATPGFIVIKNCAAHYPHINDHRVGNINPLGWWGIFGGTNSNGWRIGLSITRVVADLHRAIDPGAGITLEGTSYGGTGAILQSMILPDPIWRSTISIVNATVPHTFFISTHYNRDPAVRLAWVDFEIWRASFHWATFLNELDHIYYRINGATNDNLGVVEPDFFRLCDQHQIACFGTWHMGGHSPTEPGVNLPTALYAAPEQDVRLDQVLPVFTNSTANYWGQRGHYNLGLSWDSQQGLEDRATEVTVPLRYRRHTNIGGGIPDQPMRATFDLTLRRISNFDLPPGRNISWTLGTQSGTTTVTEPDTVTIEGLMLESSEEYTRLVLKPG